MEPWPPVFLLLLLVLLLWIQGCVSGSPAESVYKKIRRREGDTMSVQCSYKGRRNRVDGKAWCKVRKRKCDLGFPRTSVKGPSYVLRDDAKAKVFRITMEALTIQDSGRYWCMRNSSGTLYPLTGFQLEVFPALKTERTPLAQLANTRSGTVTSGQVPISGSHVPLTSGMSVLTSGLLTLASGTTRPTSATRYSSAGTGDATTTSEPRSTTGSQPVTMSPSHAGTVSADPVFTSTKSKHLSSSSPTTGMCHQLTRSQESYLIAIVLVLTFLLVPIVLVVVYGVWKKKHMGSYRLGRDTSRHCWHSPEGPEPLWKPAWSKITQ